MAELTIILVISVLVLMLFGTYFTLENQATIYRELRRLRKSIKEMQR